MDEILELDGGLYGVLSMPTSAAPKKTAVVLLNAGLVHRVGPFRMYTRIARELGAQGYPVLRFDQPGIGDALTLSDCSPATLVAGAFDRVRQRTGCETFIVGGLCSAADLGWIVACSDARVSGLYMLDGLARKGVWNLLARASRLARKSPAHWLRALSNNVRTTARTGAELVDADVREWPESGADRTQLATLLDREVRVFAGYTGGTSYFLHARQFAGTFGSLANSERVHFVHWPDADHTFYLERTRRRLIDESCRWVCSRFP